MGKLLSSDPAPCRTPHDAAERPAPVGRTVTAWRDLGPGSLSPEGTSDRRKAAALDFLAGYRLLSSARSTRAH